MPVQNPTTDLSRKEGFASRVVFRAASLCLFTAVILVLSEFLMPSSSAASLPVIDMAAIGQMIQQYEQMTQQLQTMYQQVALLKDQITALTGHYGYGTLAGRVNPWGTTSWQQIMDMVNNGVNPGDAAAVQSFYQAESGYQQSYPVPATELLPTIPRMSSAYSSDYASAMTGLGVGDQTFNSVQSHLAELQTYKDRIETTDNLKAAVDLNTAVNVKVAQLNAEILRLHAVQLHLQANGANDVTNGEAAQAEFFAN